MALRARIPFTQARRDRLFQEILAKEVGDRDGLALVEWEDGSITLKPVIWESDLSAIMDPDSGDFWFIRGRGGKPKDFSGIPVWRVFAGNAGVIATEAALIADAEQHGDVIDVGAGDEVPDDLFELGIHDPNGGRYHGLDDDADADEAADRGVSPAQDPLADPSGNGHGRGRQPTRADGGMAAGRVDDHLDVSDDAAIYDLRPPEGYDGVAIDVRAADDFDPYAVDRPDAKAAAEWFEQSVDDGTDTWMKGFLVGIGVTVALALIFLGLPWLAGNIAAGGGGGGGQSIPGFLPVLAAPAGGLRRAVRSVASRLGGVAGRVRG